MKMWNFLTRRVILSNMLSGKIGIAKENILFNINFKKKQNNVGDI